MNKPRDCKTIDEIRKEIDAIDKMVIELLGERLQYIKEITRFKKDEEDVLARQRYEDVIKARRELAKNQGLDPDVIEDMYKSLMQYFINVQKKALNI